MRNKEKELTSSQSTKERKTSKRSIETCHSTVTFVHSVEWLFADRNTFLFWLVKRFTIIYRTRPGNFYRRRKSFFLFSRSQFFSNRATSTTVNKGIRVEAIYIDPSWYVCVDFCVPDIKHSLIWMWLFPFFLSLLTFYFILLWTYFFFSLASWLPSLFARDGRTRTRNGYKSTQKNNANNTSTYSTSYTEKENERERDRESELKC